MMLAEPGLSNSKIKFEVVGDLMEDESHIDKK